MADTVQVVATFVAKAGKEVELSSVLEALVEPSRLEPGCLKYELHANVEDPAEYVLLEEWVKEEDYVAHFTTDHIRKALKRAEELLATHIDVKKLRLSERHPRSPESSPGDTLRVEAVLLAEPGKEKKLQELLESMVEPTRGESGCLRYDLLTNTENPREFIFLEDWTGPDALSSHFETPHLQQARTVFPDLLAGDLVVKKLKLLA